MGCSGAASNGCENGAFVLAAKPGSPLALCRYRLPNVAHLHTHTHAYGCVHII